jgi:hypothetical protein
MKETCRSNGPSISISSDSTESSVSSVILSMCPLSIDANNFVSITKTNHIQHLNLHTSMCKKCKKLNSSHQCETCHQRDENQLPVRSNSFRLISTDDTPDLNFTRTQSLTIETKINKNHKLLTGNETVVSTQSKAKKMLNQQSFKRLLSSQRECESSPDSLSCLHQLLLRPKVFDETDPIEKKECPSQPTLRPPSPSSSSSLSSLPPSTSVIFAPICSQLSPERINQFQERQTQLDRAVKKLMESVTIKANENINQLLRYWAYIKHICLDKYQPKTNYFTLFDHLLNSNFANKQIDLYFEEHDEIKAALQVLSTTLTIVHDKHSFSTIKQLFDNEEKIMIENLRHQSECLLSSYTDALSFIRERINYYQRNLNEENKFKWIQIIQVEYPCLIESISNDFLIKIPQFEQLLIEMLKNMNKHLILLLK